MTYTTPAGGYNTQKVPGSISIVATNLKTKNKHKICQ